MYLIVKNPVPVPVLVLVKSILTSGNAGAGVGWLTVGYIQNANVG